MNTQTKIQTQTQKVKLPKEFLLEEPACYDWVSLEKHLSAYIDTYGIVTLARSRNPFKNIVKTKEQQEIMRDIFNFTIDTAPYDASDERNLTLFKKAFRAHLFSSGFFG